MFKKLEYFLPTLSQCWVIVFLCLIVGAFFALGIGSVLEVISGLEIKKSVPLLTYLLPFAPALLYIIIKSREVAHNTPDAPLIPFDKTNLGTLNKILLALIIIFLPISLGIVTEPLSSWIPMPDYIKKLFEDMMQKGVLFFITVAFAAPLVEEFFIRGIMARGLFYHSTPLKGILWSAFFFAFIHMNPWQAVPAFCIGIILGWIYFRTHSLKICILIHFSNNAIAYVTSLMFPDIEVDTTLKEITAEINPYIYPIVYVISMLIITASVYYLNKNMPLNRDEEVISDKI